MHFRGLLREWLRFSNERAVAPGRALQSVSQRVFRSRLVARAIFGIEFAPLSEIDYYFDTTTVVLFRYLRRRVNSATRLLDLGTGSMAVLGISLWKATGCKVTACDINPDLVALAAQNVELNGAPLTVCRSNLLDDAGQEFDTVVFNPPYVAHDSGERRNLSNERRSQWDGGEDGTRVIKSYLEALLSIDRPIVSYLGMNHAHVGREVMHDLLELCGHIHTADVYRHWLLPVDIYTLESGIKKQP